MDALAREGVFFSQAYTSGHVCSPTRAGLMLGQYQQRVGIYTAGDGGRGFNPKTKIFPSFLPDDYTSMAVGKWHMGLDTDYPKLKMHALNRGFDECYKFMGRGGHDYFQLRGVNGPEYAPIYRNKERIKEGDYEGYLTTRLTEEAVAFIDRQKAETVLSLPRLQRGACARPGSQGGHRSDAKEVSATRRKARDPHGDASSPGSWGWIGCQKTKGRGASGKIRCSFS